MSIKKIAEKTGVSTATVSRVLNNPDYKCSSPQLRDKIWKCAMELNYTPNEAARSLKKGVNISRQRMNYIQILMTRTENAGTDPFFDELLHVIESEIHSQNCILSQVWYKPVFSNDRRCRMENLDRIIREMKEQNETSDGLIIIGKCNKSAIKKLEQYYKNIVSVNRNSSNYEIDEVLCDGEKVAELAVEYLISLGHREIGYVGDCHNEARYRGYINTLQKHDIDVEKDFVVETQQTEQEGFEAMEHLLLNDGCPTGIYCANDITAIGMLKCLNKYKNRYYTPSIISSDDIEQAQYSKPMLTTVRLPKEEMGKFALFLLLDRIRGGHKSIVRTELEGKLMVRNSCTPAGESRWCDYSI